MTTSSDVRAFYPDVHGVERLAGRNEESVAFWATETDVADRFRQEDLSDALALRCEDVDAVKAISGPARARPDVAVHIRADAVSAAIQFPFFRLQSHCGELPSVR